MHMKMRIIFLFAADPAGWTPRSVRLSKPFYEYSAKIENSLLKIEQMIDIIETEQMQKEAAMRKNGKNIYLH